MVDETGRNSVILDKTELEKDLGILISSDLKWEHQVTRAANTANGILAQIRNSFSYRDTELIRLLYLALVRPHLEFAVSVWNPCLSKDIKILENIQRRATRRSPKLKKKPYNVRLNEFRLTNLEKRRERGDLIQFYKIINGIDDVKWVKQPRSLNEMGGQSTLNLRRHNKHYYREKPGLCSARENFFINRIIPVWNELPGDVKEARNLNSFKAKLDKLEKFSVFLNLAVTALHLLM